jgi:hypothetical protein
MKNEQNNSNTDETELNRAIADLDSSTKNAEEAYNELSKCINEFMVPPSKVVENKTRRPTSPDVTRIAELFSEYDTALKIQENSHANFDMVMKKRKDKAVNNKSSIISMIYDLVEYAGLAREKSNIPIAIRDLNNKQDTDIIFKTLDSIIENGLTLIEKIEESNTIELELEEDYFGDEYWWIPAYAVKINLDESSLFVASVVLIMDLSEKQEYLIKIYNLSQKYEIEYAGVNNYGWHDERSYSLKGIVDNAPILRLAMIIKYTAYEYEKAIEENHRLKARVRGGDYVDYEFAYKDIDDDWIVYSILDYDTFPEIEELTLEPTGSSEGFIDFLGSLSQTTK